MTPQKDGIRVLVIESGCLSKELFRDRRRSNVFGGIESAYRRVAVVGKDGPLLFQIGRRGRRAWNPSVGGLTGHQGRHLFIGVAAQSLVGLLHGSRLSRQLSFVDRNRAEESRGATVGLSELKLKGVRSTHKDEVLFSNHVDESRDLCGVDGVEHEGLSPDVAATHYQHEEVRRRRLVAVAMMMVVVVM